MKKLIRISLLGVVMVVFVLGCGGAAPKETKVKCPKCGSTFTVDEGIKTIESQP